MTSMAPAYSYVEYPPGSGIVVVNFAGTVWGDRGVLAEEGDSVQCHACGTWWPMLGQHVFRFHYLRAKQYRKAFGLNATQPLCSQWYSDKRSQQAKKRMEEGWAPSVSPPTPHAYEVSLQTILHQRQRQPAKYIDTRCEVCAAPFRVRQRYFRRTCSEVCRDILRRTTRAETA